MGCAESPVLGMLWVVMPGSGAAWRWGATRGPHCCLEGTAWRLSTAPAPCWELVPSHCGEADDQGWFWGCAGLGEGAHLIPTLRPPSLAAPRRRGTGAPSSASPQVPAALGISILFAFY